MSGSKTLRAQQPQQTPEQREQANFNRGCAQPAPTDLVSRPFLGKGFTRYDGVNAAGRVGHFRGVNPTLRGRLDVVEAELNARWGRTPPDQRLNPDGSPARDVADWCGVRRDHIGWRSGEAGDHSSGSAIDIDAADNPYIAIRRTSTAADGTTRETVGGEARGSEDASRVNVQRSQAVAVYDRARTFAGQEGRADVAPRHPNESAGAQYDRMRETSDHLSQYLGLVFPTAPGRVSRPPVRDPQNAAPDVLIARITEANPRAAAVAAIQAHLTAHPNPAWTLSADETYLQILRDYESVRIPMQHGRVSTDPSGTRNPAAGFLHFTRTFTEVMMNQGELKWGATGLEMASGDMMHFELRRPTAAPAGICPAGPQTGAARPSEGGGGGS